LLDFVTLLDDGLFDVVFAAMEELAQFGTDDEERSRHHGAGDLQEQESGAWISVSVSRLLKCNRKGDELGDGKQNEQCAGEMTHALDPLKNLCKRRKAILDRHYFTNF
jgi:hypothetical protein